MDDNVRSDCVELVEAYPEAKDRVAKQISRPESYRVCLRCFLEEQLQLTIPLPEISQS